MTTKSVADLILGRSQARRRLLALFFSNADSEYYLRELERLTSIPVGNIRRELNPLAQDRLFVTRRNGNLLLYRLNRQHPHYKELKKILTPTLGVEALLKEALKEIDGIGVAFIYGSYAASKERSDSDIDIIIIGTPDRRSLTESIAALEGRIQREINYKVYTALTFKQKRKERNPFIMDILSKPKIFVIGDTDEI